MISLELPRWRTLAGLLLCLCALAGCGGGSNGSQAERSQLAHKLAAQTASLSPDLSSCVVRQAEALPISQLRAVTAAGGHPAPGVKRMAVNLVTTCVRQGKGVTALRSVIGQKVASTMSPNLPSTFRTCLEGKAGSISASQLAQLLSTYATAGQAAVTVQSEQLGRQLAAQCLTQPAVVGSLRSLFLRPIRILAQDSHYPLAFRQCILRKAEHVSPARIEQFALHPSTASTLGRALGVQFGHECIAQGA